MPAVRSRWSLVKLQCKWVQILGWVLLCVGITGFFALSLRKSASAVDFGMMKYTFEDGTEMIVEHPSFVPSNGSIVRMEVPIEIRGAIPIFRVKPDDCIEQMAINGQAVTDPDLRFCDYTELGPVKNITPYLRRGQNNIVVTVRDHGGSTGIRFTPIDSPAHKNRFPFLLLLTGAGAFCLLLNRTKHPIFVFIVIFGIMLRILYVAATPYSVRGHDTGAHIEYIQYVAEHWRIPPAADGWEFHQAPLYYFFAAAWHRIGALFGWSDAVLLQQIQIGSLIISIGTLLLTAWIAFLLFPTKKHATERCLFMLIVATFPALIFLAARITNNGLYHFFAFVVIALLLQWWRSQKECDWLQIWVGIVLSFLTKVSGLIFMPVALMCYISKRRRNLQWKSLFMAFLIFFGLAGWLPIGRFFMEHDSQNSLTFGSQRMHPGLRVETSLVNLTMFNPVAVLQHPFNSPWDNAKRRQYFWEYFFRSAFFGEFNHPRQLQILASITMFLAMLGMLFMPLGIAVTLRWQKHAFYPLIFLLGIQIMAHMAYRFYAPFTSNQDFRFSIVLILSFAYFVAMSRTGFKERYHKIMPAVITGFSVCCSLFIMSLYFLQT